MKNKVKYYNNLRNQYLGGGLKQFAVKLNITKTPELFFKSSKHIMARRASLSLGGTVVADFIVVIFSALNFQTPTNSYICYAHIIALFLSSALLHPFLLKTGRHPLNREKVRKTPSNWEKVRKTSSQPGKLYFALIFE